VTEPPTQPKARLPRYHRAADYPALRLGRPEHRLLLALARYHYLTAAQCTRLLYQPSSLSFTREHLKRLYHGGFVDRVFVPALTPAGSPLPVYCLDRLGFAYVAAQDAAPEGRFRSAEQAQREWYFMRHFLASNDFLIAAERLTEQVDGLRLAEMRHERELKRTPLVVSVDGDRVGLVPDAWLDLRRRQEEGELQACFALELDYSGGVNRTKWQRRIAAYLVAAGTVYPQAFGTPSLTVCVLVRASERRLAQLLTWTETVLTARQAQAQADLFRFAYADPATLAPAALFGQPGWQRPFERQPVRLLRFTT